MVLNWHCQTPDFCEGGECSVLAKGVCPNDGKHEQDS